MIKIYRGDILKIKNKKLLIFDLDGTLIDSSLDLSVAVNLMLKDLGYKEFDENTIKGWVGNGAEILVKRALSGEREFDEDLSEEFVKKALEVFLNHYENNLAVKTKPYKGVFETLSILKQRGFTLTIATNKPYKFVKPLLKKLELDNFFSYIIGGDSLKAKKPDPSPLLHIIEKLSFAKDETIMIGDSKNDIIPATKLGIDSIAVTYGYNYDEDIKVYKPTAIVEEFQSILKLLGIKPKVAVIGGGIAGSMASYYLAKSKADVTLFEKNSSLVSGPPFCHLHSGGNLYPQISDEERIKLLTQSIELLRVIPQAIDFRPTVVSIPKRMDLDFDDLLPRLQKLQNHYKKLVQQDIKNKVLGEVDEYFKIYTIDELEKLKELDEVTSPKKLDEWMIPFAKYVDLSKIKSPVFIVQEYGINLFRTSALLELKLKEFENCKIKYDHEVKNIEKLRYGYKIEGEFFDYLINSAGYKSGDIDSMLDFSRERFVEFKAAYVSKWKENKTFFPEMIFLGDRGTPDGMGQFTPYFGNYFQLHGMTKDITLFDDCLTKVKDSKVTLPKKFENILSKGWDKELVESRTKKAIEHLSYFIPKFANAKFTSTPLYGAQQIPGNNPELRAFEVSFEKNKRYARCEIVKASSVIDMSKDIFQDIKSYGYFLEDIDFLETIMIENDILDKTSQSIAKKRDYPESMGKLLCC